MSKFIKKKINVPLLIVLLICAVAPGILYLIYCSIPTKVPTKAPKSDGKLKRLIGSGLTLLTYVFAMIYFGMEEGLLAAFLGLGAGFAALVLIVVLLSLKPKGAGVLTLANALNVITLLVTILICIFLSFVFYIWIEIPMIAGVIVTFCGVSNGKKKFLFDKYSEKEAE